MCPPDIFIFLLVLCKRKICNSSRNILKATIIIAGHDNHLQLPGKEGYIPRKTEN